MRAPALLALLLVLSGTVRAQDPAAAPAWVVQKARTADFVFEVRVTREDEGLHTAEQVRVIDRRTGTVRQMLEVGSMASAAPPARLLQLLDANFDGSPDLVLPNNDGGAGPNHTRNFYLFDSAARRYVHHPQLSELPQPVIGKNRTITSTSRGGCCEHSVTSFRFEQGELVRVAERSEKVSDDGEWVVVTAGVLRQGRWEEKVTKRPLAKPRS